MRTLLNIVLGALIVILIGVAGIGTWFFLYTSDLPDMSGVGQFAPAAPVVAYTSCHRVPITAIPAQQMGTNVRAAIRAAEPEWLWSSLVARSLFCEPRQTTRHALDVLRVDAHLRLRFSKEERLTIYANRVWFGEGASGVHDAAQRYFHKDPASLTVSEAAFLAGMTGAPSYLFKHPDEARKRRNQVLEKMVAQGSLAPAEAKAAEAETLPVFDRQ